MADDTEKNRLLLNIRDVIQKADRCIKNDDLRPELVVLEIKRTKDILAVLKGVYQLEANRAREIEASLDALHRQLDVKIAEKKEAVKFQAPLIRTGERGRPQFDIPLEQLKMFHDFGFTAKKMAQHFGCSTVLVYKRLKEEGISQRGKYTDISDQQLDEKIESIHSNHPNTGSVMMAGYLEADNIKVQRRRVRSSLRRIDPASCEKRCGKTAKRRTYSVPTPNHLWHIDGHMKLNRWGIATHGGIDGYSRLITYLMASTDNRASTVLEQFVPACLRFGVPNMVRSDMGGENLMVGLFMNVVNKDKPDNIIAGRSVHNQRIERLWKDIYEQEVEFFYKLFYDMEDEGLIDIRSTVHLTALKFVFIPIINCNLKKFMKAHNKHKVRTEGNRSPEEVWISGVLDNLHSSSCSMSNLFDANSLEVTLVEALAAYQINIDLFPEYEEDTPLFDEQQTNELNTAISQTEVHREKYCICLRLLQNSDNS
ncbi:unnamed protein product [Mytilus edulis]|uniref:Integrase catalytic domain-containing protein n=1 Tax=Mytilus edulis TaxID=6550 RepID=A0A8S3STV3_MYTED|nr:unnamed protein product [Mytilus edulis]